MTDNPTSPPARTRPTPVRSASDAVYGLGLIGAAVYFIQHASSFGAGILGILEAIIWPVIIVYKILEFFFL